MKKNVGSYDRIIRIILAAFLAVLYFTNMVTSTFGLILLIIGGILVVTGFISFCPIYKLLGISSRKEAHTAGQHN